MNDSPRSRESSPGPVATVHAHAACRHCGVELDLHQPDAELSERLLATCVVCKTWYLIEGHRWQQLTAAVAELN